MRGTMIGKKGCEVDYLGTDVVVLVDGKSLYDR